MFVGILALAAALGGLLIAPDMIVSLACSASENLPCRPLTLECLFVGAGGLGAGLPAIPPWPRYVPPSAAPDRSPREYAPSPPPGYQPSPPQSPQDALNNPDFKRVKDDWARDNADRVFPSTGRQESKGMSVADVLVEGIRNKGSGR
jgi:hypothetical protein